MDIIIIAIIFLVDFGSLVVDFGRFWKILTVFLQKTASQTTFFNLIK